MGFFRRIRHPVQGHATIVECWKGPPNRAQTGAAAGNCKMQLELDVPGVARQVVKHNEPMMTENRWPEVGMRVAVTVDADHPDRVDVDWDSVFGERLGGKAGIAAEWLGAAAGVDLDLSKGPPKDPDAPPELSVKDKEAAVKALNDQLIAGQITPDQMAAGVRRVMGIEP